MHPTLQFFEQILFNLSTGKLLRSLQQSERIPSWGGITVRRGILAMSCPEQEMLQLFRLSLDTTRQEYWLLN